MADTTQAQISPGLFAYLKKLMPNASDADIMEGYRLSGAKPENDADIARGFSTIPQQGAAAAQAATPNAAPVQSLDPVTITGKAVSPDTTIAAMPTAPQAAPSGAGALDALYAGNGPTAKRLGASDPSLYTSAADQLFHSQGGDSQLTRTLNGLAAATRAGLGGQGGAIEANQKRWDEVDAAHTTGKVKEAQALADKGLAGANAALTTATNANVASGDLDMRKRQFILDQRIKGVSADQAETAWDSQKDAFDPASTMSKAAVSAAQQLSSKIGVDPKTLSGMTLAQIQPILQQNQELYKTWLGMYNAETSRITAVPQAAKTTIENEVTKAVTGAGQGKTPEEIKGNLGAGGYNWSGAGLAPSPAVTGGQSGAAAQVNDLRARATANETNGVTAGAQTALNALGSARYLDTGKFGEYLAKVPGTDAAGTRSAITSYYTSRGMDPQSAAKEADAVFGLSPKQGSLRMAAIIADTQTTKQQLADQDAVVKKQGSLQGFVPKQYFRFYNPKTGDVIVGDSAQDKPKGYVDITKAGGK